MKLATKVSTNLSSKILTIGPEYRNHRGGVGAVIEIYSRYFEVFNFISSHKVGSGLFKSSVFFIGLIKFFFTLLSNRNIKIIHIHGASYGSFYRKFVVFVIGKYIFRKHIIYHIHGGSFQVFYERNNFLSKRLIKTLLAKADTVICLSQSWYEFYKQNFKTKKLVILPNIIDYPEKLKNTTKTTRITFLFLGLICEAKGIYDVVNVLANNKEKYRTRIKLLIGGNGKAKQLQDLIEMHQIEDIVEFLGWVSSEEKIAVLNKADVYILPSYKEGLPISILEAMSYGQAIISTNVGGIPEIVIPEKNGILIEPGNLCEIEAAIDFFIKNPEKVGMCGLESQQIVQRHLPDAVIKQLSKIYESLLNR